MHHNFTESIRFRFHLYSLLRLLTLSLDNQDNGEFLVKNRPGECVQWHKRIKKTFFPVCYKFLKVLAGTYSTIPALTLKASPSCFLLVDLRPIMVQQFFHLIVRNIPQRIDED